MLLVELRGLRRIVGDERDMLDACHALPPSVYSGDRLSRAEAGVKRT
jgi:hypothetical protein